MKSDLQILRLHKSDRHLIDFLRPVIRQFGLLCRLTVESMEQQDYLKKQIDQLGQVLAKIFSDLLGLKNRGQLNTGLEISNQALKNELGFDIQDLLDLPTDQFIAILTTQKNLPNDHLDKLAEILLLIAENQPGDNKKMVEKCLTIYAHLEKTERIYRLDRQEKINRLKNDNKGF